MVFVLNFILNSKQHYLAWVEELVIFIGGEKYVSSGMSDSLLKKIKTEKIYVRSI